MFQSISKIEVIKWVITFLIGVCTGLVAFFIDTIVKLLSKSKFHLVDECILWLDCPRAITKTYPGKYTEIFIDANIEIFIRKYFIFFLIIAQSIDCGYSLEPPRRGGSDEYPQSMFWIKNRINRYTPACPSFA